MSAVLASDEFDESADLAVPDSPRVMIGDDHRLFSDAMAVTLQKQGWQVCSVATTLEEVLDGLTELQPEVLLLDVWFPTGSSLDVLEALVAASPDTAVVMLSALGDVETMSEALRRGAGGFGCKTDGLESIIDVVVRVLAGEVVVRASQPRSTKPGSAERLIDHLTPREHEVLRNLVEGRSMAVIAHHLGISYSTARSHTQNVLMKLGVHSQVQAVAFAVAHGIVPGGNERGQRLA